MKGRKESIRKQKSNYSRYVDNESLIVRNVCGTLFFTMFILLFYIIIITAIECSL